MNGNILGTLLDVRGDLRDCVRNLERTQSRIAGPRPKETGTNAPIASDNLGSVASDISMLTQTLSKMVSETHGLLVGEEVAEQNPSRAAY